MYTHRFIAFASVVCFFSILAGSALANDAQGDSNTLLKGKYRLTGNKNCAAVPNTEPPFIPTPLPTDSLNFAVSAGGFGYSPNLYFTGVYIYDGNGQIMAKELGTLISPATLSAPYSQGSFAVAAFEETCEWKYSVNRNGKYTAAGSCTATNGSYKITGFKVVGQVEEGGAVVNWSPVIPPVLETLEFFDTNGTLVGTEKRLCGGATTIVRIRE